MNVAQLVGGVCERVKSESGELNLADKEDIDDGKRTTKTQPNTFSKHTQKVSRLEVGYL